MKKVFLSSLLAVCVLIAAPLYAQNVSMQTVVTFLNENGMTKFTTVGEFRANDGISRGEAAKFIAEYANAANYNGSYDGSCAFSDIAGYDYTLTPHIDTVCKLGLIKGSQGQYRPTAGLSEAEALTILSRSQTGFEDETGARWYGNYFIRAQALGLVSSAEIDSVATTMITRGRLGLWITTILAPELLETTPAQTGGDDASLGGILEDLFGDEEDERTIGTTMNVRTDDSNEMTVPERKLGATINYYEDGSERRDGFVPYSRSAIQNALNNDINVVLYFSADWCPTCQTLTTNLEAQQFQFPQDLLVVSVDFDTMTELKNDYGVSRQHTLVYLDSDGNEIKKTVGAAFTLEDIESEIE